MSDGDNSAIVARVAAAGLSKKHIAGCQKAILRAAHVSLAHANEMHYTEGPLRWSGIDEKCRSIRQQAPPYSDCSSWATWCYWDGVMFLELTDILNGQGWKAGYTGTLIEHGRRVYEPDWAPCDLIFYGPSPDDPTHVALYIGGGKVISHGGDPIQEEPIDYRPDRVQERRYLL